MSVILCTAGYDHNIRFWEALSGICSRTIQHPESQVNRLCITPNKRYLAAAGRHVVRLYDIASTNPNPVMTFEGHSNNITGVAFHCEGKWMVTSSEDCTVRVWDTRSGTQQRNYTHLNPVNDVVIHPNQGELISADRGGNIRVWDLGENRCTHQLIPEDDVAASSVSVASDGSLLAAGNNNGNVYIWRMYQNQDSTTLLPCRSFNAHRLYLTRLLISPDVKALATCSADHSVKIWKIDPAEEYLEEPPKDMPNNDGKSSTTLNGLALEFGKKPLSTNAPSFATSFGRVIHPVPNGTAKGEVLSIPSTLANGEVADFPGERPLPCETVLAGHQRWVWDCAFSADSAYLVSVSSDHYARLWELSNGQIIRQYNGHHRGAVCVALNDYSEPR
ncbi:hypothetical protein GJ744_009419 [Endocarpon pusillum]|uniref:Target of rapamycin complex subunit LST8 n=1 Tax=Endocarpon pusillum TaxID=364733 RepID=A0A8H7AHM5_9EURO|nr:hypothetical protein GJ744_009419 [Endocarpon pusillum]